MLAAETATNNQIILSRVCIPASFAVRLVYMTEFPPMECEQSDLLHILGRLLRVDFHVFPFLGLHWRLYLEARVTRTLTCSVRGVVAEMRQIHKDYRVLWRKGDQMATLSRGEHPNPCLDRLLLLFWAHYIEDGPHLLGIGSL